jgi:hypothetical protein
MQNNINMEKCKKCDFDLRRGDFIMFLKISQLNGSLQKLKNHQNIHLQLIHVTLQEGLIIKDI